MSTNLLSWFTPFQWGFSGTASHDLGCCLAEFALLSSNLIKVTLVHLSVLEVIKEKLTTAKRNRVALPGHDSMMSQPNPKLMKFDQKIGDCFNYQCQQSRQCNMLIFRQGIIAISRAFPSFTNSHSSNVCSDIFQPAFSHHCTFTLVDLPSSVHSHSFHLMGGQVRGSIAYSQNWSFRVHTDLIRLSAFQWKERKSEIKKIWKLH